MRVALATYSTKPRGGVVHTLALAEALAAAGCEVSVWALGLGGFFRPVDPAVTIRLVPFEAAGGELVGDRILRAIAVLGAAFAREAEAYDIVHAQDCLSANALGRCVRTIHHLDTFRTPALAECHERAVVDPCALVCVSAAVAAEVRAGWGRVATVIPNGVDADRFARAGGASPPAAAAREAWRRELGSYVLAVGGIEPRKGTLDLLEAFALLRSRRPEIRLVLAGGETLFDYRDYRLAFEDRARELGVDYDLLGPVAHEALPSLVAACAAFSFVSTKEGFGLAALEALAAGVPVVARDLPVLREVLGGTVRYAADPPAIADALHDALTGPNDPGPGRALAAGYRWADAARAHLDLYQRLLAAQVPGGR